MAVAYDILYVIVAVLILWKCADYFVEGAVGIAERLRVPQMLVGMVLVSIATTSPELMTSFLAALQGQPELALGNAVGSVVIDASVALGLAAVVASTPLLADPTIFRSSALVLLAAIVLAFLMCLDGTLSAWEGAVLLCLYVGYATVSYFYVKRRRTRGLPKTGLEDAEDDLRQIEEHLTSMKVSKILLLFVGGFVGVILGSKILLVGAQGIAAALGMAPVVIGLTVTAIGTSTPEVATCVASALKRQSGIGVGNIIGADILNICWVAGLSSIANPLTAQKMDIYFMFPAVFIIVSVMLMMLRYRYRLTRLNGVVLLCMTVAFYAVLFAYIVPSSNYTPLGH